MDRFKENENILVIGATNRGLFRFPYYVQGVLIEK